MTKHAEKGSGPVRSASELAVKGSPCYLIAFGVTEREGCPRPLPAGDGPKPLFVRIDAHAASISVCVCGGEEERSRDLAVVSRTPWPLWRVEQGSLSDHAVRAMGASLGPFDDEARGIANLALGILPRDVSSTIQKSVVEGRPLSMSLNLRFPKNAFDPHAQFAISALQEAARGWKANLVVHEFAAPAQDPLVAPDPSTAPALVKPAPNGRTSRADIPDEATWRLPTP